MKKTIIYILICATSYAQSQTLTLGTNTLGVSFADVHLTQNHMNKIFTDLKICFNSTWLTNATINKRSENMEFSKYVSYWKDYIWYANGIEFPYNIKTDNSGNMFLHVRKELSDSYTNAFEFANANSNAVVAAYDFVSYVSSSNFVVNVTSNQLHNYIFIKEITDDNMYAQAFDELWPIYFGYPRYYPPSILGFYYSSEGPEDTNLWVQLPTKLVFPDSSSNSWLPFTALWHDNKWKICTWHNPFAD